MACTDGVSGARNRAGEEFGEERLRQFLARRSGSSPAEVIRDLRAALREFSGDRPLGDDTTIIVCKRIGQ